MTPAVAITTRGEALIARSDSRFYRPELDALRFAAFCMVFVCHSTASWNGTAHQLGQALAAGVCLFFTLSAYLITELMRREKIKTGAVNIQAFYTRRILRIWPLYFCVVLFCYFAGLFVPSIHLAAGQLMAFMLLLGNVYVAFHGFGTEAIAALWSISVEEQFYLLWPSLFHFGGRRVMISVCLALPLVALGGACFTMHHGANEVAVWVNSLVQFQFFGLGALLALVLNGRIPRMNMWFRAIVLLGSGALLLSGDLVFHMHSFGVGSPRHISLGYFVVAIACVGLILGALGTHQHVPAVIVRLGKISYGLYMFHGIALWLFSQMMGTVRGGLLLVKLVLVVTTTVSCAALSYKYLETPFLRLKEKYAVVQSRRR